MSESDHERVLDVREIDGPPFDDIVATLDDLGPEGRLRLLVPFEPVPLYDVLESRGFAFETASDDGLYRVLIEPR